MAWVIPGWGGPLKKEASDRLERALLGEASSLAEELVVDFFRLGGRGCRALQYEVLTDQEFPLPLPADSLAALLRAEVAALLPHRRRDFYFIFLRESRLAKLEERDFLYALLLYIFTHELIHMVRFMQFAACFWMMPHKRWEEERLVHTLCRKVLQGLKFPRLDEVLKAFNELYQ